MARRWWTVVALPLVATVHSSAVGMDQPSQPATTAALPTTVAGIPLPQTQLALRAAAFARQAEPDFLFNHSVRTYVFGALRLNARNLHYDAEAAFVAALFHDLGLLPQFASEHASFEVDGANRAEAFLRENGASADKQRTVWNAIATHDMSRAFQAHQGPEALLLGAGAGSDVDGPDPAVITNDVVARVLDAFPRQRFKTRFTALATDHCRRKPASQSGWLDILCRETNPGVDRGSVRQEIADAPFAE
jgi:hypothetical protein